jgi:hypothetical protein
MTNLTVANTILAQLGGNRFIAMTGCKNFGGMTNGLSFHIPRATNKAKFCTVTLDAGTDTYAVKFQKQIGGKFGEVVTVSEHAMIYADRLASLFSEQTGLAVSL